MSEPVRDRSTAETLATIYATIGEPLEEVQRRLDKLLRSPYEGVDEMLTHVSGYHGKRMRPAMALLVGRAFGALGEDHIRLAMVVEILHTATLIHDDIIDEADVRRQAPSVNRRFGNERAVLLGDFLFSEAFHLAVQFDDPEVRIAVSQLCRDICLGEILEVIHRFDLDLGEELYVDIIHRKTALLFETGAALAARLGGADADTVTRLGEFARYLGLAFQVVDDCLDLVGEEAVTGKSLGNDLAHGMTTMPVIHFLREATPESRETLRKLLEEDARSVAERRADIRDLLRDSGAIDSAYRVADDWVARSRSALDAVPPSPMRQALVEALDFVVRRIC